MEIDVAHVLDNTPRLADQASSERSALPTYGRNRIGRMAQAAPSVLPKEDQALFSSFFQKFPTDLDSLWRGLQHRRRERPSLITPVCFIYNLLEDLERKRGAIMSRQMS